jgi:hypothetical protein
MRHGFPGALRRRRGLALPQARAHRHPRLQATQQRAITNQGIF